MEDYLEDLRTRQEKVRPAGTPRDVVYPLGEISLPAHVTHWAAERSQKPAIVFEGRTVTYAELDDLAARLSGWLDSIGVRAGDRVGVYLPNCPQFVVAMLAVLRLGAVHVPINPMFRAAELAHELDDSGAEVVITLDALLPTLDAVRVRHVLITGAGDMAATGGRTDVPNGAAGSVEASNGDAASVEASDGTTARTEAPDGTTASPEAPDGTTASPEAPDGTTASAEAPDGTTAWADALACPPTPERPADLDALAALNYTGGTTGLPKGCEHTQRHMVYTAASSAGAIGASADGSMVALCYIPIFWIAGEDLGILNPLVLGGTSVLMPRWDPAQVLRMIEEHRVSIMVGTVENYLELLDQPGFAASDLTSLTHPLAVSFVRKLSPDVRRLWVDAVGPHSVLREAAYGMTETHTFDVTPYGFDERDRDLLAEPVFCGVPVPGTDVAVVSWQTGEPVALGEVGEIVVRSPSVMTRYWRNLDATAQQLRDGWLHTGDNGRFDADGCLSYLGRDKDMIKVKGMSVFPAEVEMLLARHSEVRTVAVVPADDPDKGQVPVAFVRLEAAATSGAAADGAVSAEELYAWAKQNMASYKVPLIEIVTEFPMTTTGKIRKVELEERASKLANASEVG